MRDRLVVVLALIGCGGGGGSTPSPGPDGPAGDVAVVDAARATELCMPVCEREVTCNGADLATCMASCTAALVGRFREDAATALTTCTAALACGASDVACGQDIGPLPYHEVWETACRSSFASCGSPGDLEVFCEVSPDPTNDDIGTVRYYAPAVVDALLACLELPTCEERAQCMFDVLSS